MPAAIAPAARRLTVFIPAAGTGSRLRPLTDHLPKALVPVRQKPAISHVIDLYPRESRFVVAAGHKSALLREYLGLAYPELDLIVVEIANFDGPGSGLGHTIAESARWFTAPLVFHAVDSLLEARWLPSDPDGLEVLVAAATAPEPARYRRIRVSEDGRCLGLGEPTAEPPPGWLTYTGVCLVQDVERLAEHARAEPGDVGEAAYLRTLIPDELRVAVVSEWHDIGTPEALEAARRALDAESDPTSEKLSQATFVLDDAIVKVHADAGVTRAKRRRGRLLSQVVPTGLRATDHCLAYPKVEGRPLSTLPDRAARFPALLEWLEENLWPRPLPSVPERPFAEICLDFYRTDTLARVSASSLALRLGAVVESVDDVAVCSSMAGLLESLPWPNLADGVPVAFHGDLHFDNVLVDESGRFVLVDWRETFGSSSTHGDLYYELAKLRHSLVLPNAVIDRPRFSLHTTRGADGSASYRTEYPNGGEDAVCLAILHDYLRRRGLDAQKVRIVGGLVFLRMAPLYRNPAVAELLWVVAMRELAAAHPA